MLLEEIEKISKIFKSIIREKRVRIISHYDADGLCSAAIMVKTLLREGVNFELRTIKQLTKEIVENISFDENDFFIFLDLGSGHLKQMKKILEKTQVLVLDHHEPVRLENLNLFHLNPLLFGGEEISSSMLCYLFSKSVNLENTDLIDLGIVGAVGDEIDENWEFKGKLARKILEEAEITGKITITKGLRLYGRYTRPVHKSLEYSFNPIIPGITGSESGAVQFLSELNIPLKQNGEWRKLKDLTLEEQKKLASAIIIERLRAKCYDASDIFGEIYEVLGRPEELQDAREFATTLNACGRTMNFDLAIRICLGDLTAIEDVKETLDLYRSMISESISWIRNNKDSILMTDFANYIFCENKVPDTIIGTVISILLDSNLINSSKPVFGFANAEKNWIKISARASRNLNINLREVIVNATKLLDAESGGHRLAAGAYIKSYDKDKFVKAIDNMLGELVGKES